jgi:hypothetical protein
MQVWRGRRQSQPTHKQDQHHECIEEARGLKTDVHIGNGARENKEYASDCKQLSERFDLKLQLLLASRSFAWLHLLDGRFENRAHQKRQPHSCGESAYHS